MTLQVRLSDLATRIATECKSIRSAVNGNSADLSSLSTTAKGNLVAAINELDAELSALASTVGSQIDDSSVSSSSKTWSASKISTEIQAAKNQLLNGSATALDTLSEIAAAIGNDSNFAATMTAALGNRVRYDAAQALSAPQQTQACQNIGVGDPDTNFVTVFNAGLL